MDQSVVETIQGIENLRRSSMATSNLCMLIARIVLLGLLRKQHAFIQVSKVVVRDKIFQNSFESLKCDVSLF